MSFVNMTQNVNYVNWALGIKKNKYVQITACLRIYINKTMIIFSCFFKKALILSQLWGMGVVKIGSSLKSNHHYQI